MISMNDRRFVFLWSYIIVRSLNAPGSGLRIVLSGWIMVFMTFVFRHVHVLKWKNVVCLALTSSFGRALVVCVSSGGLSCVASAYIVMHLI